MFQNNQATHRPQNPSSTPKQPRPKVITHPGPIVMKIPKKASENWSVFKDNNSIVEMVLSKKGRCMFPYIELSFDNIESNKFYSIYLEFITDGETVRFNHEKIRWEKNSRRCKQADFLNKEQQNQNQNQDQNQSTCNNLDDPGSGMNMKPTSNQNQKKSIVLGPPSLIQSSNTQLIKCKNNIISGYALTKYGCSFKDIKLSNNMNNNSSENQNRLHNEKNEHEDEQHNFMSESDQGSTMGGDERPAIRIVSLETLKRYTIRAHLITTKSNGMAGVYQSPNDPYIYPNYYNQSNNTDSSKPGPGYTNDAYSQFPFTGIALNHEAKELCELNYLPKLFSRMCNIMAIDTFTLDPEMFSFVTVTSYQNAVVTDIKIVKNPHSRGPSASWKHSNFKDIIKLKSSGFKGSATDEKKELEDSSESSKTENTENKNLPQEANKYTRSLKCQGKCLGQYPLPCLETHGNYLFDYDPMKPDDYANCLCSPDGIPLAKNTLYYGKYSSEMEYDGLLTMRICDTERGDIVKGYTEKNKKGGISSQPISGYGSSGGNTTTDASSNITSTYKVPQNNTYNYPTDTTNIGSKRPIGLNYQDPAYLPYQRHCESIYDVNTSKF